MKKRITDDILTFMSGSRKSTTAIENFGVSIGYRQEQVLGGIGYLRSKGIINIVRTFINPITGRKEHVFN